MPDLERDTLKSTHTALLAHFRTLSIYAYIFPRWWKNKMADDRNLLFKSMVLYILLIMIIPIQVVLIPCMILYMVRSSLCLQTRYSIQPMITLVSIWKCDLLPQNQEQVAWVTLCILSFIWDEKIMMEEQPDVSTITYDL